MKLIRTQLIFEMDLYWAVRVGYHPLELFKEHPSLLWHVKDMDKVNLILTLKLVLKLDFKSIFAQAELSGMKRFFRA
jgi:hypothetical protein